MTIEVLVGEQGKLFGSVTSRDIAERLQKDTGVELEHRQVHLNQPIREIGTHEVPVRLTRNVIANITVNVHPEGGMPEPEPEPEAAEETEAAAEDEATEATAEDETTETAADEPAATEASADDSPAEEAAPAPAEETATTETPDAPDEATEDEEKGAASREGS